MIILKAGWLFIHSPLESGACRVFFFLGGGVAVAKFGPSCHTLSLKPGDLVCPEEGKNREIRLKQAEVGWGGGLWKEGKAVGRGWAGGQKGVRGAAGVLASNTWISCSPYPGGWGWAG